MKVKSSTLKKVSAGFLTGAVNGLFGGGGGMIAVPLLKALPEYTEKQAHATAIFLIAPVCAASAAVYIINGYASPDVIIPASIGSVAGGFAGACLLKGLSGKIINYIFIAVMLAAGLRMLF